MGAGFYLMIVASILMYRVAVADKKTGWIWSGINLCITMAIGKLYGVTVLIVLAGFVLTFLAMFIFNIVRPKKLIKKYLTFFSNIECNNCTL